MTGVIYFIDIIPTPYFLSAFFWELVSTTLSIMLTLAIIIYVFMCFISNWDIFWPLTMLSRGGLGDWAIVIIWAILLIVGLN